MSERKSNMEALRILSMLMVLTVHIDGASLGLPSAPGTDIGAREAWKLAVEAAAITGVNCFTMISGYFGIRLRFRSIASSHSLPDRPFPSMKGCATFIPMYLSAISQKVSSGILSITESDFSRYSAIAN